ncbi:hypothetical protein Tsubulata_014291 [Turnera subulata]|uniref:G domain-containing protein n=1 Tax=Turnera subulata TaxID=218843 RepID=A0A9Q0EZJ2_9ROSI|nr:hypothetical protein Tsubulata_014291 [Turnera subulata]
MKALRALRSLTSVAPKPHQNPPLPLLSRFFSAQPQETDTETTPDDSLFDSSHYAIPASSSSSAAAPPPQPTWDEKYRERADRVVFNQETHKEKLKLSRRQEGEEEEEEELRSRVLAKALLEAALEKPDEEVDQVLEEDQKSLSVGIIGAPNAGKSSLTNYMVGMKVSAVSRKTNTTIHEVLGVMTKGDTQICFFDTPGLMLKRSGFPGKDVKARVECAWSTVNLYDVLIVIFDVHRHLTRLVHHCMRSSIKPLSFACSGQTKVSLCLVVMISCS